MNRVGEHAGTVYGPNERHPSGTTSAEACGHGPNLAATDSVCRVRTSVGTTLTRCKQPEPHTNSVDFESASELYRSSDRRRSAKLVPTLADRGCHVVSATSPPDLTSIF
jgi:hypothetical protein